MFILLNETLQNIRTRLQLNNIQGVNVRNTDRVFVAPILQAIGWNMTNLNDVVAEYSVVEAKNSSVVTYALCSNSTPLLLVEVLPLFSDVTNKKLYNKVITAFKNSKAEYLSITNGVQWLLYNKGLQAVLYIDLKNEESTNKLGLLQKTSIQEGVLENYFTNNPLDEEMLFKTRQLKARGYRLSEETHRELNELKKQINATREVKTEDISVSLLMECILKEFLNNLDKFNHKEITNEVILQKKIKEVFK